MTNVSELKEALGPQLAIVPTGRTDVPALSAAAARKGLKLGPRTRELLRDGGVEGEDRSARLFELAALLCEDGADETRTFALIRDSRWNKFEGRDDEVERLWEAVERSRIDEDTLREEELRSRLRVGRGEPELVSDFLERHLDPPSWYVRGILQQGGLHFVAAPKKCYKSTFVTDLAYSLVSGSAFLNDMPVEQQASVLMIQEENPESLQQLRMRAMRRAKNVELHPEQPSVQPNGEVLCDFSSVPFWQVNRSGLRLVNEDDRRTIENWVRRMGIEVLILDPLYILAGCEILHGKDIMDILDWWLHLKHDLGVTIVVVHHMKKLPEEIPEDVSQLMFGSSYLANAYDGAVLLMPRYAQGSMVIDKVHCVRDYRAWREGAFDFSIFLEEDGSEYIVQVDQGGHSVHPLVHLVAKQPGILRSEAAKVLGIDESNVSRAAKRHGLVLKKVAKSGGGRRKLAVFPQNS